MSRFLIEISRRYGPQSQRQMDEAVRIMGSHFVTHADWRVKDGCCTGKMIAELPDRDMALLLVPPSMRPNARIVELGGAQTLH